MSKLTFIFPQKVARFEFSKDNIITMGKYTIITYSTPGSVFHYESTCITILQWWLASIAMEVRVMRINII